MPRPDAAVQGRWSHPALFIATTSSQWHVAAANRPASPTIREPSSSTDSAPSGAVDGTSRNTGSPAGTPVSSGDVTATIAAR
jgi:hypothetical protein